MKNSIYRLTIATCIVLIALLNIKYWDNIRLLEIPIHDEVIYASGATPVLQGDMKLPSITYSPLYSLFYLPFIIFLDRIDAIYFMSILLQTFLPITIFLFLIRRNINIWFSLSLALLMPVSYYQAYYVYNIYSTSAIGSQVYSFAVIVWMICLIAISYRLYYIAFVFGILAIFARQEYILSFIGLAVVLFLLLILHWRRRHLSTGLFRKLLSNYIISRGFMSLQSLIFLLTIFAIFLLIAISHPDDSSARSMYAFCQHYALLKEQYKILSPDVADLWSDCQKEIMRDFPGATTVLEAFLVNPEAFINHLTRHVYPSNVLYNLIGMVRPLNYYENFTAVFIILCSYSLSLVLTTILLRSFRELLKEFVGFIQDNRNLFIVSSFGLFATMPAFIILNLHISYHLFLFLPY